MLIIVVVFKLLGLIGLTLVTDASFWLLNDWLLRVGLQNANIDLSKDACMHLWLNTTEVQSGIYLILACFPVLYCLPLHTYECMYECIFIRHISDQCLIIIYSWIRTIWAYFKLLTNGCKAEIGTHCGQFIYCDCAPRYRQIESLCLGGSGAQCLVTFNTQRSRISILLFLNYLPLWPFFCLISRWPIY